MKQKGLVVEDENRFLTLSEGGAKIGDEILKRRAILEHFFENVLGVSKMTAEIDACKTEHLLGMETTKKMADFAKKFKK